MLREELRAAVGGARGFVNGVCKLGDDRRAIDEVGGNVGVEVGDAT